MGGWAVGRAGGWAGGWEGMCGRGEGALCQQRGRAVMAQRRGGVRAWLLQHCRVARPGRARSAGRRAGGRASAQTASHPSSRSTAVCFLPLALDEPGCCPAPCFSLQWRMGCARCVTRARSPSVRPAALPRSACCLPAFQLRPCVPAATNCSCAAAACAAGAAAWLYLWTSASAPSAHLAQHADCSCCLLLLQARGCGRR